MSTPQRVYKFEKFFHTIGNHIIHFIHRTLSKAVTNLSLKTFATKDENKQQSVLSLTILELTQVTRSLWVKENFNLMA